MVSKLERNRVVMAPVLKCIETRIGKREQRFDDAHAFHDSKRLQLSEASVSLSSYNNKRDPSSAARSNAPTPLPGANSLIANGPCF